MTLAFEARAEGPIPLDLAFRVAPGELLALVGPSGSGKTTVLRTIAGLWQPDKAKVTSGSATWLDTAAGIALAPHRRGVGVVFQSYALFPHMSALGNVLAAMAQPDRAEAARLLDLVNLHGLNDRFPAALSGGQQQRVALARALARRPDVLLLDEPFSAVDRPTREKLHSELLGLRRHLRMPVILVTHDMTEAQALADRMAIIDRGHLVRTGETAEVMSDPAALRVLGLREIASMLSAQIEAQEADGLTRLATAAGPIWLPRVDAPTGTALRVRVLAHEVILSRARPEGLSAQNILAGQVLRIVEGEGPGVIVHVGVGADEILARITRRAATALGLKEGDLAHVILKSMSVARDQVAAATEATGGAPGGAPGGAD